MTAFPVTSLHAGLLGLLLLVLSFRVSLVRRATDTPFGTGDDPRLGSAIRAQGNFIEYAPITLLLLVLLEAAGAAPGLLHILGGMTVGGRLLHALGISPVRERLILRQMGMLLSWAALGLAACLLLYAATL
nr:MAPEG family protein [uncultured Roseococcus sp.]